MLDCQLFGLKPGPHHLVNLFFHIANTVLLFLVLHRMTKGLWKSAFVAAVFAIHPLHIESVAWLAERGRFTGAIPHYEEALRISPDDFETRYNLANALARQGRLEEAISQYAGILKIPPDVAAVHNNMGIALAQLGRSDEAVAHFREAIRIKPDFREAGANLEKALVK